MVLYYDAVIAIVAIMVGLKPIHGRVYLNVSKGKEVDDVYALFSRIDESAW